MPPPRKLPNCDVVLPHMIIGDEAFALTTNMMKPYPRAQSVQDKEKAIYNYRHSRARRVTENAFGILAAYFRVFHTPIAVRPETADRIIVVACILHNMMRKTKVLSPIEQTFGVVEAEAQTLLSSAGGSAGRPCNAGRMQRDTLKEYFNGVGAVKWQNEMI